MYCVYTSGIRCIVLLHLVTHIHYIHFRRDIQVSAGTNYDGKYSSFSNVIVQIVYYTIQRDIYWCTSH